jgi:DNA-binding NtrC family response regulator
MNQIKQVLIVEDDQQWQGILSETLEDAGYGVTVIGDYPAGRQALQESRFDLVVVDLELDRSAPMFEGQRLLNLISRQHTETPCIVVSAQNDPQIVREAFKRYRVVDFIGKDIFDIPTFMDAVHTALGKPPAT